MSDRIHQLIEFLGATGGTQSPFLSSPDDFNRACRHVLGLLRESVTLLRSGGAARAAFLAISALEETAKISLGPYTDRNSDALKRRGALYSHPKKQALGAGPLPLELRPRLVNILGEEEAAKILEMAWTGGLTRIRESAIYFEVSDGKVAVPEDSISLDLARSVVIFSLDAFEDCIVGMTKESYEIGSEAEALLTECGSNNR